MTRRTEWPEEREGPWPDSRGEPRSGHRRGSRPGGSRRRRTGADDPGPWGPDPAQEQERYGSGPWGPEEYTDGFGPGGLAEEAGSGPWNPESSGADEPGPEEFGTAETGTGGAGFGGRGGGPGRGGRRRRGARGREDSGSPDPSRAGDGEPRSRAGRERETDPAERARAIALRLLTGAPRTRKQLADALSKREIPDEVVEEVLSRFEEVGLIDDSAFADAWVESRHRGRGLARRALVRELRTKGVDPATIDEAVGQLDSDQEEATARELLARKLRSTRGVDRDKRFRRLASFLARKGYPEGMALRLVREALEQEGEELREDTGEFG